MYGKSLAWEIDLVVISRLKLQFYMTPAKRVLLQQECQGCQPPRLQMINDVIMHTAHDVICKKRGAKKMLLEL